MDICKAMRLLELNRGYIKRSSEDDVMVHFEGDSWEEFLEHRVTLWVEDLTAIDWEHFMGNGD